MKFGKLKGKKTGTVAQAYWFAKGYWDMPKIRAWLKKHKLNAIKIEKPAKPISEAEFRAALKELESRGRG